MPILKVIRVNRGDAMVFSVQHQSGSGKICLNIRATFLRDKTLGVMRLVKPQCIPVALEIFTLYI